MFSGLVELKNTRLAAGIKGIKGVEGGCRGNNDAIDKHRAFRGHNRPASFPDISHKEETQLPVFSRTNFISSEGGNHVVQLENRHIVSIDAEIQYLQTDFAGNKKISLSNKIEVFHKLNDAMLKLRDQVGKRIGEKYMDTLTKKLSFVVMSRGGSTTKREYYCTKVLVMGKSIVQLACQQIHMILKCGFL